MIADITVSIFFTGIVFGILLGAMLHAGLDERGIREDDWCPTRWEIHQYQTTFKNRPLLELAAEGKELKEFLEKINS